MPNFDDQSIVLAILAGSLILFITDAVRFEVTALAVVVALVLTGVLDVEEGFDGFSSSAVVLIAAMYMFGHAFTKSGLAEGMGRRILGAGPATPAVNRGSCCGSQPSQALSSVLSNTGVVATLIPVANSVSHRLRVPLSGSPPHGR